MITTTRGRPVPSWVTDGWYANNPSAQALAIVRYRTFEVASPAEVATNRAYLTAPNAIVFACGSCGRFAFANPTTCFWCQRGTR